MADTTLPFSGPCITEQPEGPDNAPGRGCQLVTFHRHRSGPRVLVAFMCRACALCGHQPVAS
jgi:hypothetical protein